MLSKKIHNPKNQTIGKNAKTSNENSNKGNQTDCCQLPAKAPNQLPAKTEPSQQAEFDLYKKNQFKTQVIIKFDAGFLNQITIRGNGANLNWVKGKPLKNIKHDEWIWETDADFTQCEFKVLINDSIYETGDNHLINSGATLVYSPRF